MGSNQKMTPQHWRDLNLKRGLLNLGSWKSSLCWVSCWKMKQFSCIITKHTVDWKRLRMRTENCNLERDSQRRKVMLLNIIGKSQL